jgi:hypothetical protein
MRLIDILEPIVNKVFGRNQQFHVKIGESDVDVENLWPGEIGIYCMSGGMRNLNMVLRKDGCIILYVNAHRYWEYDVHDPDVLDKIQARLVEFAQKKVNDLEPEERFRPYLYPG